ncbi:MAG: hypothetical protein HIU85_09985 [Proteobacteria bacterium]|nr:hypothetical protein [Pseudomonadota bacterium]
MEHRWGRRIAIRVPVRLIAESAESVTGHTENVSISGAFIRTTQQMPLWTRLEVEFSHAAGPAEKPQRIAAHVTRRTRDGVGIEWYDLAPHTVRALLLPREPHAARQARHDTRPEVRLALELQIKIAARIDNDPPQPQLL